MVASGPQALEHSSLSVELGRGPLKGDCHSVHAGILKDLGRLEEAEQVVGVAISVGYMQLVCACGALI